jgi:hypothetical protein
LYLKHFSKFIFLFLLILFLMMPVSAITWTAYGDAWTGTDGAYTLVMWNQTGAHSWVSTWNTSTVEYLVLAGGGGGGVDMGGGGGAGGCRTATAFDVAGVISIVVGDGGAGGVQTGHTPTSVAVNGADSVFSTITATGGGAGGRYKSPGPLDGNSMGLSGGSGGGGCGAEVVDGIQEGGARTDPPIQGFVGRGGWLAASYGGGAGGGAGAEGLNGSVANGGNGGRGIDAAKNIAGYDLGGGGAGSAYGASTPGTASHGGGTVSDKNGDPATGAGGGGLTYAAGAQTGGKGGSGVVVIKYIKTTYTPTPTPTPTPTSSEYSSKSLYGVLNSCNGITWALSVSSELGYNGTMIFQNGTFLYNLTNATTIENWYDLGEGVGYEISTKIFYLNGTSNTTWKNSSSHTALCHCWYCGIGVVSEPGIPNLPAVRGEWWLPGLVMRNAWWLILLIGAFLVLTRKR